MRATALSLRLSGGALLLTLCALASGFAPSAASAVTRSCNAEYVILTPKTTDKIDQPAASRVIARFRGQGSCSRVNKNKCRERARDAIIACARSHASSGAGPLPAACTPARGVHDYGVQNLTALWTATITNVCCTAPFGPQGTVLQSASLVVRTSGDRRCGFGAWNDPSGASRTDGEVILFAPATVHCSQVANLCRR